MRTLWLATAASLAAIAVQPAPANAEDSTKFGFSSGSFQGGDFRRDHDRRDRHRDRGFDGAYYLDREYQGDTAWRRNSYNDWWHERPMRSYPAWVQRNQGCERMWWSGGGWRC